MKRLWIGLAVFLMTGLAPGVAHAGNIRTVYANDHIMQTIALAMGRSTVLRFDEKPQKVVIGNQNYFGVEYIGDDVAIQPQGIAVTNLIVYTEYQTYGLILRVGSPAQYDDMVYVKWRPPYANDKKTDERLISTQAIRATLTLPGAFRIETRQAIHSVIENVWILDLSVVNLGNASASASEAQISVASTQGENPRQRLVFEQSTLPSGAPVAARLIVNAGALTGLNLTLGNAGKAVSVPLIRRRRR